MKIGYAQVSTLDQNPDLQTDALEKAGCERILVDKESGAETSPCEDAARFRPTGQTRQRLPSASPIGDWGDGLPRLKAT